MNQHLKDAGHGSALPEQIRQLLGSLAADGRDEAEGRGSLKLRRVDAESVAIELLREWSPLEVTARRRREAANCLLAHLLACLPPDARGVDLLTETSMGKLLAALNADLVLAAEKAITPKLSDRALLWLHEQNIIRLNKGLAVFRPAMTIRLAPDGKARFTSPDFAPLKQHYDEQVVQIHVMAEYVQRGLKVMTEAMCLTVDYFSLPREEFMRRWLPERDKELTRQTTPQSWHKIVEILNNKAQRDIVADERESTNVLVLAGPGSGKTRVLVHRIAYSIRVRRENPRGILALAYNRHAAVQIRQRLKELIGEDARGVSVLTLHALAMRLVGASLAGNSVHSANKEGSDESIFKQLINQAVRLLKGSDLLQDEADEQRDRLLAGFRWILVDEYQDISRDQYELISALAGRTRADEEGRIHLFAVGDDDQNIYAFNGASIDFIRRYEADYAAKAAFLIRNYRSTAHIIEAANHMIAPASRRMKIQHPVSINSERAKQAAGGEWAHIDPVGQGRVQILPAGNNDQLQALAVMAELQRLAALTQNWDWARCAVIAREWKTLDPVRSFCELNDIPVQLADENSSGFWSLRETQALIGWLRSRPTRLVDAPTVNAWLEAQPKSAPGAHWWDYLREAVADYVMEAGEAELPRDHFIDWLAEWAREARRRQTGLLLLTAHKAKGLEFDHVVVLDGEWSRTGANEDSDAPRRLYYVAMTRARQTLTLARMDRPNGLLSGLPDSLAILRRQPTALPPPRPELFYHYQRLSWVDVNLDFAGTKPATHGIHQHIAKLSVGSYLRLQQESNGSWFLCDTENTVIGKLSRNFGVPAGIRCISAWVAAIHVCSLKDVGDEHKARISPRCETWETVIPKLVFAQC